MLEPAQQFPKPFFQSKEISPDLNGLQPLLNRLDSLIQHRISTLQTEKKFNLSELPKNEILYEFPQVAILSDSPVAWLQNTFNLSPFDLDILIIALAPELDRNYEQVYGILQNDLTSKRPTVDMVLNLLCSSIPEKVSHRQHFTTNSPLIYHRLLHLIPDSQQQTSSLLAHHIILDSQVVRFLLHQSGLDFRLISDCQLLETSRKNETLSHPHEKDRITLQKRPLQSSLIPDHTLSLIPDQQTSLITLIKQDWENQQPLLLYFQGSDQNEKRHTAQNFAKSLNIPLLVADLARMVEDKVTYEQKLQLLWREAWFFNYLLYINNFDLLYLPDYQILYQLFFRELEKNQGITILAGVKNWIPTATNTKGIITINFTLPNPKQRQQYWQTYLKQANLTLEGKELNTLSDRFLLTSDQIADAVTTVYNIDRLQSIQATLNQNKNDQNSEKPLSLFLNLCNAARTQSGHDLATLAQKITPKYTWNDIILPANQTTQLKAICKEIQYRDLVHQQWGFADKLSLGKGLNVLFSGASGTGKTMAAEVIANELQLDLYKIDLSQVVSKYIGETEKNLNRIFTAATNSNAILFFDEADALFGKRSEIQDARDRYANIEVGYLLQKMEEYEGIAILTTNLRNNIDDAFERRLRFIIEFSPPDSQLRYLIWQKIFPNNSPCSPELDLEFLAENFELTGANIRNIALTAAFLAADDEKVIKMVHLIQAIRQEYQKMGQILRDKDLGEYRG